MNAATTKELDVIDAHDAALVAEQREHTRTGLIARLVELAGLRETRDQYDRSYKDKSRPVHLYLEANDGDVLYDGEHNLEALLASGGSSLEWDSKTMADDADGLGDLAWLARRGLLDLKAKALKEEAAKTTEDGGRAQQILKRWTWAGSRSPRFLIRERMK
jgi:hypothetical protein